MDDARQREIDTLVADLGGLLTAERAATTLVRHGAAAIGPLRHFLLGGRPSHLFQPRRWAVRALGALGAVDVLIDYLRHQPHIADDEIRFGEEVVQGEAALQLAAWGDADVTDALLEVARRRTIPGVIEALGRLRVAAALPLFVRALEDDFSSPAAARALTDLGRGALGALVDAATSATPDAEDESAMSVRRRRRALEILETIGIDAEAWRRLRTLLADRDPEVRVKVARLALAACARRDAPRAVEALLAAIAGAPSFLADEIEDALVRFVEAGVLDVGHEVRARADAADDPVVRALRRVTRRLG